MLEYLYVPVKDTAAGLTDIQHEKVPVKRQHPGLAGCESRQPAGRVDVKDEHAIRLQMLARSVEERFPPRPAQEVVDRVKQARDSVEPPAEPHARHVSAN